MPNLPRDHPAYLCISEHIGDYGPGRRKLSATAARAGRACTRLVILASDPMNRIDRLVNIRRHLADALRVVDEYLNEWHTCAAKEDAARDGRPYYNSTAAMPGRSE